VKSHAPDLIIMDINLPFSSGLRAVKQIREATGSAETPVIFLTASKVPALREQAIALGAAGFLEKPYDANQLAVLVRVALAEPISPSSGKRPATREPGGSRGGGPHDPRRRRGQEDRRRDRDPRALRGPRRSSPRRTSTPRSRSRAERKPVLVVVDLKPPLEAGLDSVRRICDASGANDTPVVFISASKIPEVRAKAKSFGAAGFLEKPYDAKDLLALIRKALAGSVRA
jgi:CheY-like chemotaxis protein